MVQKGNNLKLEIILHLLKGEDHIRGTAKNLEESHTTVLRRLNELLEDNVIGYRLEGRNKVCCIKRNLKSRNYVFNAEHYKQIKLLRKYPELNVIAEDVLEECDEDLIIIFGSYANFSAQKNSDIDIYVETRDRKVKNELESIHSRISVKIGSFDLNSPLIKEIIKNHVILKGVEEFYEKIKFFD